MARHSPPSSPRDALRTLRLIGFSLPAGVTLFGAVAWFVHLRSPAPPPDSPGLFYLWIAMATSLLAASMIVWRGRVVPILEQPDAGDWRPRASSLQTGVVTSWALVEAAALIGVVIYFLAGFVLAGGLAVAMMWAALILTWPREEWLATARRSP